MNKKVICKTYSILSDGNKRGIYDETGCIPDDDSNDDNTNWVDIWKLMFKSVTLEVINVVVSFHGYCCRMLKNLKRNIKVLQKRWKI